VDQTGCWLFRSKRKQLLRTWNRRYHPVPQYCKTLIEDEYQIDWAYWMGELLPTAHRECMGKRGENHIKSFKSENNFRKMFRFFLSMFYSIVNLLDVWLSIFYMRHKLSQNKICLSKMLFTQRPYYKSERGSIYNVFIWKFLVKCFYLF
jgi:hypothetical protein